MAESRADDAPPPAAEERDQLALVQFVGAIAYGQLRAWAQAAASVPLAPDVRTSEQLAHLTGRSFQLWQDWRAHLDTLTDLPSAVVERQREAFDQFFDADAPADWEQACTVLAFSWPLAQDFATLLAPHVPDATRELVVELSAGDGVAEFALEQLGSSLDGDDDRERVRSRAAELVGRALAGYQQAMIDSDALEVLLGDVGEEGTRRLAVDLMARHHRRLAALGVDDPT